jgi:tetratricopeptide (TPR) repeat protein
VFVFLVAGTDPEASPALSPRRPMNSFPQPVVLFFAFANDRTDPKRYLRNLPEEARQVRAAMAPAVERGLCETVERPNVILDEVLNLFQDARQRDRIAVFHFGGHAGSAALLLESAAGAPAVAHAPGLARFLGEQRGLELVFLNGCSSQGQAQSLLDAGVPAVIATSQAIDDQVATEFASRFYRSLASGTTIRTAYAEAAGAVETRYGRRTRRDLVQQPAEDPGPPWSLHVKPGAEERLERWSLPFASDDPQDAHLTLTRHLNRRGQPAGGHRGEAEQYLSPYSLSVPLVGRTEVLADQWRWMRNGRPVSVRVMTAPAGAGKTRLALELCDQAVREGWVAGFLTEGEMERFRSQQNLTRWGWKRPMLIVVDYAASRARLLRPWLIELAAHPGQEGKPLRLLLLERHANPAGGWWRQAFGLGGGDAEAVERLLDPASVPYLLPALANPEERRAVLASILERTGSTVRLPEPGASPAFERRLAEISWGGEPLFLLMAGLVAAQAGFGEVLALSAPDLGLRIARHEIARIHELAKARDPRIPERFLAHLAAYVTLCQGLSRAEVEAVVAEEKEALLYPSAGDPPEVYEALAAALRGDDGGVAPILPDVVGEAVALEALGAAGGPEKSLLAVSRAARRAGKRVTASLIHLAQDYGAGRPEPVRWLTRLAEVETGDLDALGTLLDHFPGSSLVLRQPEADLARRAVDLARKQGDREPLAWLLEHLSACMNALGSREAALAASEESVSIRRDLAASRPDARPDLASSLSSLSVCLSALGRHEAALAASEESVSIYRDLAASRPDAFRRALARSLGNLSADLNAMGRQETALAASEESVSIYRDLASSSPDAFRPELAGLLGNMSKILGEMGRQEVALAANEESVSICRDLAVSRPDSFRPDLARSLNNLSMTLSTLGRHEAALAAIEESVSIYRELAAMHLDSFQPELATSLANLSKILSNRGSREAALATIEESVSIYRDLAAIHLDSFQPELARSLVNLSKILSDLGSREAALAAIEESVLIYRDLAASRPDALRPGLAIALSNLSMMLSALGRHDAALATIEEAVSLDRDLAALHPEAFRPYLAMALNNLSMMLSTQGDHEAALATIEEAVPIYRDLAKSRSDAHRPELAMSLSNLSAFLDALGRRETALAAGEEAVSIYRDLAASYPDAFLPYLAGCLSNLSMFLSALGRQQAALGPIEESVPIYRDLAAACPDAFLPALAMSLNNLSKILAELGSREAALAASEEAVSTYRDLAVSLPDAFRPDLAMSLNGLSVDLRAFGRLEEGLAASQEALSIYQDLAASRPDAFRPDLAKSLNNLSVDLTDLGRPEEGLRASEEAVSIYRELASSRPDAFRSDLAMALHNRSMSLSALGSEEAALAASEEAVSIFRDLAASTPDAFRPNLALSLNNLSNILSGQGSEEEALRAIEEAVSIYRDLAASQPNAFRPDLAMSLSNLSRNLRLSDPESGEAALAAIDEAVRVLAPSFLAHPAAFQSWMARMVRAYQRTAEAVDREPDSDLLRPLLPLLEDHAGLSQ